MTNIFGGPRPRVPDSGKHSSVLASSPATINMVTRSFRRPPVSRPTISSSSKAGTPDVQRLRSRRNLTTRGRSSTITDGVTWQPIQEVAGSFTIYITHALAVAWSGSRTQALVVLHAPRVNTAGGDQRNRNRTSSTLRSQHPGSVTLSPGPSPTPPPPHSETHHKPSREHANGVPLQNFLMLAPSPLPQSCVQELRGSPQDVTIAQALGRPQQRTPPGTARATHGIL